jgi:hypothetical protein
MSSKSAGATAFVALSFAIAVAMLSLAHLASEKFQKLQTLALMSVAPEAAATAGAIGENPEFPVSP